MKASDLLVKALENEGVKYILGVPGEENLDFLDSIRKSSKITMLITRHEQAAAFMAATIGRLTGKAGVCLATLGPGATNLVTGAAYAQLAGVPMMMITGQKPIHESKQGAFQIVDVVQVMDPLTKFTRQVVSGARLPSLVRESLRLAEEERPGAVHLELPEDVARQDVDASVEPFRIHATRRPIAEHKAIAAAVDLISRAKRPLLLIGAGANRKVTSNALTEFIQEIGIPFFNTQMGKGVVDERNPLFIGTAALSTNDYLHLGVEQADLIINCGHDVVEKPPFLMQQSGIQKVIHVNFYSAQVDDVYFPDLEVIGDIGNAVWQLKESLKPNLSKLQEHWDFEAFFEAKKALEAHIAEHARDDRFPVLPQRLVEDVRRAVPDDGIIALDNGMYKIWFARNYRARGPNTILLDNALATMGAGLPSAMAARLVEPEKVVVAIAGDGGFMMNSQELETAVRAKMNLVILVLNDNAYGMIKWKQALQGLENWGLDYGNPDFVKYAEAYGAHGHRVTRTEDLESMIRDASQTPGVHLIEVPVDYSENARFTEELKNKTHHPNRSHDELHF